MQATLGISLSERLRALGGGDIIAKVTKRELAGADETELALSSGGRGVTRPAARSVKLYVQLLLTSVANGSKLSAVASEQPRLGNGAMINRALDDVSDSIRLGES